MATWRKHNLSEEDKIWFGKYEGTKLKDIPTDYFRYLIDKGIAFRGIKNYAFRRIEAENNKKAPSNGKQ